MTNIDNEREAFEKWVRRETEFDLERQTNGEYAFSGASDAYAGWLARAQADKAVSVEALERLAEHFDDGGWRTGVDYVNAMMEAASQIRALIAKEMGNG